ncbi:SDR family NAD(P)-dependent oxidoreductase [Sphingomonas oligoaromativorans]|uniref:SDR family NAD(P)-dependent oxidoreductase n=1 Tax=Sphingomonas oligoaromativorans TaxID=575322 RepID=UPI001FB8FBCD|nr:SDR family NAD(P)-dependent oxidoreductase [Sphingomonas oligoaromativorans]NIJ33090.1 NAD(P)-dependent dehydrogenase (short-subunit alcohol dehydrogenase family) [Sphingomonas oligoaromativorans]
MAVAAAGGSADRLHHRSPGTHGMNRWTIADMGRQDGRRVIVTGANSGIGYETARALAEAGATLILAARDEARGRAAAEAIGHGAVWRPLDLACLASVERFAGEQLAAGHPVDRLILNAGVMALPERRVSADGFELQLGTNLLGHFALAARLWPLLAAGARVVPLASIAAWRGRIDFADPMAERRYDPWAVYAQSKLAMLMFGLELARRAVGTGVASVPAHPGFARTSLLANGPGTRGLRGWSIRYLGNLVSQSAAAGALPVLRAATDPDVHSGDYLGSTGPFELRGPPGRAALPPATRDHDAAARLWAMAEDWVGLPFRP